MRLALFLALAGALSPAQTVPGGIITRLAGCGTCADVPDGGPALTTHLSEPAQMAIGPTGEVYFVERIVNPGQMGMTGGRVRKITADGKVVTVAGNGTLGDAERPGDGSQAAGVGMMPDGVAVDAAGNVYIGDRSTERIRKVTPNGMIFTLAVVGSGITGGLAADKSGNVYACLGSGKVVRISPAGTITTVAGTGSNGFGGDGGQATTALLATPNGLALDAAGDLYISDEGNNRIRKVTAATGIITTVAGNGNDNVYAEDGDGGPALAAPVPRPNGVAVDSAGNIYIPHWMRIRKVTTDGIITTVVGRDEHDYSEKESANFCCTGLLATGARVDEPEGIAVDSANNLYFVDAGSDNMILKVSAESYSGGPKPVITAVVNAADYSALIAPYTWVAIMGTDLSAVTRGWNADTDFVGGALPQHLDGVRVYVEGWPTMVSYVSPTQINALVFHRWDTELWRLSGKVKVEVVNPRGRSAPFEVERDGCSPGIFRLPVDQGQWAVAYAYSDGALIGPPGILPGAYTRPAKPGDILTLYGTGFGQTSPATPAGALVAAPAVLANDATFKTTYGTIRPAWAGLIMAGLYQFNFIIPADNSIPDGDYEFVPSGCQGVRGSGVRLPLRK